MPALNDRYEVCILVVIKCYDQWSPCMKFWHQNYWNNTKNSTKKIKSNLVWALLDRIFRPLHHFDTRNSLDAKNAANEKRIIEREREKSVILRKYRLYIRSDPIESNYCRFLVKRLVLHTHSVRWFNRIMRLFIDFEIEIVMHVSHCFIGLFYDFMLFKHAFFSAKHTYTKIKRTATTTKNPSKNDWITQ